MDICKSKACEVLLLDGTMSGPVLLRLLSYDLVAVKIPRCDLANYKELFSTASIGIYFLFSNDDNPPHTTAYIGESENMYSRLKNHLSDERAWHTAVAFCATTLNKAVIRFIEDALVQEVKRNGHTITTQVTYNVTLSETQKLAAQQFMKNIRDLLDVFGFTPFAKVPHISSNASIFLYSGAKGVLSSEGFTVFSGSPVSASVVPSLIPSYKTLRESLSSSHVIQDGVFTQNYEFASPSAAASIIKGCTINGRNAWKLSSGKTLKQFQEELASSD